MESRLFHDLIDLPIQLLMGKRFTDYHHVPTQNPSLQDQTSFKPTLSKPHEPTLRSVSKTGQPDSAKEVDITTSPFSPFLTLVVNYWGQSPPDVESRIIRSPLLQPHMQLVRLPSFHNDHGCKSYPKIEVIRFLTAGKLPPGFTDTM